jgi:hypothetical protein
MPLAIGMLDILTSKRLEIMQEEFTEAFLEVVFSDIDRFQVEFIPYYRDHKGLDLSATVVVDKESGANFMRQLLDAD